MLDKQSPSAYGYNEFSLFKYGYMEPHQAARNLASCVHNVRSWRIVAPSGYHLPDPPVYTN